MKVTGRPEDAVAVRVKGDESSGLSGKGAKVIVLVFRVTVKLRNSTGAGE
jgi:hypothetical protein